MTQVVQEILQRIEQLPEAERLLLEQQLAEAKRKRQALDARGQEQPHRSQAELLADLRRHSHTPPAGTPESVELLRQDRER
jgi:predicted nucleic acid-binding Zn ribbon protein